MTETLSPQQKGRSLEQAIGMIESTILKAVPSLSDKSYKIFFRKIIIVDKVRHEIDVWVEFDIGPGYKAVFIFESKNWKKKIGKDHILVFSKKIEAAQAQKGFFVAKSFTKYAMAAAELDPRIVLLEATDNFINSGVIDRFHNIVHDLSKSHTDINFIGKAPKIPGFIQKPINMNTSIAQLNGSIVALLAYVATITQKVIEENANRLPTQTFPDGVYHYDISREIILEPKSFFIDGIEIEKLNVRVKYQMEVVRPAIVAKYEIKTRGRAYTFDVVKVGDQDSSQMTLVETFPQTPQ